MRPPIADEHAAPNSSMQHPILIIRQFAGEAGIFSLSHLAALEQIVPGITATALSELIGISPPAMSHAMTSLEGNDLITRVHNSAWEQDRRRIAIARTAKGQRLLDTINALFK